MKEKVIGILRRLDIPEFKTLEDLCELPGAYVNMESELPDGITGKLLDDSKTYLCCQVPIIEMECYGVASDEDQIVIYRYASPVWPATPEAQQQMVHLDFHVENVEEAVTYALSCGANMSETQCDEGWRVMLDPAGHPFCLFPPLPWMKKA